MPRALRARARGAADDRRRGAARDPAAGAGPPLPQAGESGLRLLRRIAAGVDPESLDAYRAHGGYAALDRALELGRAGVLHEVAESHLLGRGGAAFPTGTKWEAVARQPAQPHYLVCNADESEPGTFKDRVLMEGDPFALVEAMTIAAYATGCEHGYVYVRAEYPLAHARLENAFAQARAAACSATTSSAPASRSTSSCASARARTSAARRRRSSSRSRAIAASRATSRRSRSRSASSASRPS